MTSSSRPEFPQTLTNITGLEERDGLSYLLHTGVNNGKLLFLNSGVWLPESFPLQSLIESKTAYQTIGTFATNYFRQGSRLTFTTAYLGPADPEPPHFHPGGEIAFVRAGEYFDADMDGTCLRTYTEGSKIFYPKGSTHRPLTRDGAYVEFLTFDGIVSGKDAQELLTKMKHVPRTDELALEFALLWMVPDEEERIRLRTQLGL